MNKNRFAKSVSLALVLFLANVMPELNPEQTSPPSTVQASKPTSSSRAQSERDSRSDVFAGLSYTEEQKAAIDKIHQETASRTDVVLKDNKLAADQKDAMLVGYSRMEFAFMYKVLTPEQQRQVRERIR